MGIKSFTSFLKLFSVTITFVVIVLNPFCVFSQKDTTDVVQKGKFFGKFFFNYHLHMNDTMKSNGVFESTRCLVGYDMPLTQKLKGIMALDFASTTTSAYTVIVKCAYINWEIAKPVKMMIGIIDMPQFNTQEKMWGYRYVMKSYQDEYLFGASNDVGMNIELTPVSVFKINMFIVNGEGNKKVQDDFGMHRFGGNIISTPVDGLTFKLTADLAPGRYGKSEGEWGVHDTSSIIVYSAYAGYKFKEKLRIGAEYNAMNNGVKYNITAEDYNLSGFSAYATYTINSKWEIFSRYDHLESNKPDQAALPWNVAYDGDMVLGGIQYTHVKGFNVAMNYRTWMFSEKSKSDNSFIYLNLNYSF